jgi:hypothetical protein
MLPAPPAQGARQSPLGLIVLPLLALLFGDRWLGPPWLRVADVLGGAFLLLWARVFLLGPRRRELGRLLPSWSRALLLFVGAGLLSGFIGWARGDAVFAPSEFLRSAARLVFGALLAVACAVVLRAEGDARSVRALGRASVAAALVGLLLWAALAAGVDLPSSLACGQGRETCSALYYERRWFGDASPEGLRHDVFARAQGLASEPTRFGYLLALPLGLLLLRRPAGAAPGAPEAVIALGVLASFALAAYALLALVGVLFAVRVARDGAPQLRRRGLLLAGVLALVATAPPLGPTLRRAVVGRVERMAQGGLDSSAWMRVSGGWALAGAMLRERPLTGVGLGQFDVIVEARREALPDAHLLRGGGVQGWNALAYVLGTTGPLGLLAFLNLCWRALRAQPLAAPVFVLGLFADGTVLAPAFWILLAWYAQAEPTSS